MRPLEEFKARFSLMIVESKPKGLVRRYTSSSAEIHFSLRFPALISSPLMGEGRVGVDTTVPLPPPVKGGENLIAHQEMERLKDLSPFAEVLS